MSSNITGWLYIMFVGWAQAEWTFADLALLCGFPSVCPSVTFYVNFKQYLLNYPVHSYHQKVKIIKQILTFVVRWIRDNIFQAKDVFTSHARWIRLLLEKYYHVFTSTKVNICILFTYIYPHLPLICPYLVIFTINCPNLPIYAIFTLHIYSSSKTAPLCKMLKQSEN